MKWETWKKLPKTAKEEYQYRQLDKKENVFYQLLVIAGIMWLGIMLTVLSAFLVTKSSQLEEGTAENLAGAFTALITSMRLLVEGFFFYAILHYILKIYRIHQFNKKWRSK